MKKCVDGKIIEINEEELSKEEREALAFTDLQIKIDIMLEIYLAEKALDSVDTGVRTIELTMTQIKEICKLDDIDERTYLAIKDVALDFCSCMHRYCDTSPLCSAVKCYKDDKIVFSLRQYSTKEVRDMKEFLRGPKYRR